MNIIFFGSDKFGVPSLKALRAAGYLIPCVVTQPDRRKGRGLHFEGTAIKETARALGINIFQPKDINSAESIEYLKIFSPDILVIIAYGQILSQGVLDIARIMPLNLHASLLPAYRGAAPINWAIIKGEKKTGVSVIQVIRKMDSGPVILQEEVAIAGEDSAITLEDKLAQAGVRILLEAVVSINNKSYKLLPQDEKMASLAPKLRKSDGAINWNNGAQDIYNLIRGCSGWPGAFTHYKNKLLKIYKAEVSGAEKNVSPGEITKVTNEGLSVATARDNLVITQLQMEGSRAMSASEFLSGHRINIGERFITII